MAQHPEIRYQLVSQDFDDGWHYEPGEKTLMTKIVTYEKPRELAFSVDASFLTPREREVIELTVRGMKNQEIAETLGVNLQAVKNHKYNITDRLRHKGFNVIGNTVSIINCLLQMGELELRVPHEE